MNYFNSNSPASRPCGVFYFMTENYDGIEWEIDDFPSTSSSGDEPDSFILEFNAAGIDENGIEVSGTAFYTENLFGLHFDYVEYDHLYEDYIDDEEEVEKC